MLSRQDNENTYVMFSDTLHFWDKSQLLLRPTSPWEFVQMGNCGSPIETDAGWLVLSHGVGPSRKYSIGAFLLDRDDPTKVIGRLRSPLLTPNSGEREGYVPNVVYSCGAIVHNGILLLAAVAVTFVLLSAPAPAQAASTFYGIVVHVSDTSIKVEDPRTKQTLSFEIVPHFDQIFSANGKTTYQMKEMRPVDTSALSTIKR
jgi:hypothetical protein